MIHHSLDIRICLYAKQKCAKEIVFGKMLLVFSWQNGDLQNVTEFKLWFYKFEEIIRYIRIHKTRCPTTGVSRAKVWHIKRVNTSFVWTTTLEEIEKGFNIENREKEFDFPPACSCGSAVADTRGRWGEDAVRQLTGAQTQTYNQTFVLFFQLLACVLGLQIKLKSSPTNCTLFVSSFSILVGKSLLNYVGCENY